MKVSLTKKIPFWQHDTSCVRIPRCILAVSLCVIQLDWDILQRFAQKKLLVNCCTAQHSPSPLIHFYTTSQANIIK